MISHLTESWAGVYLQVAATILVFALGIPYIVEQISVPEDLRRIIYRHRKPTRWLGLSLLLVTLVTLCFIWWLHPIESDIAVGEQNVLASRLDSINNIIASILMSLIVLVPFLLLWLLRVSYRKDRILNQLRRKCERRIQRKGMPDEVALDDIRHLGQLGKTEGEKMQVIKVLERLAKKVQAHRQYEGNGLEDVIKAIEFTLQKEADVDSFSEGVQTLKRITENISKSKLASSADTGFALRALQRLGHVAITKDNDRPALKVLEVVASISREAADAFSEAVLTILELGGAALKNERYLVAVEALSKLEAMTWPLQPLNAKKSAAYLGLVAYFWVRGGASRQKALYSLKGIEFTPSRQKCLKEAQEIHFRAARFDTADKLTNMFAGLK